MRFEKLVLACLLPLLFLSACGGGGNSVGTLTLSLDKTTVDAGTPFMATATYTNPLKPNTMGLTVTFISPDHPELIDQASADTTSSGIAKVTLTPKNIITKPVTLTIRAVLDDLRSDDITITVNPKNIDTSLGTLTLAVSSATVNAGDAFSAL